MEHPDTRIGRLSDLAQTRRRADWSGLNQKLKSLQPGEDLIVQCPPDKTLAAFRSTILTNGRRFHRGEWALATRTEGRKLHCFLAPRKEIDPA